jgi:hypothetical protein
MYFFFAFIKTAILKKYFNTQKAKLWISGVWHRVVLYTGTKVSEEFAASKLGFLGNVLPTYQTTLRHVPEES